MALIKCPECSREISDKASTCPNCGFPIAKIQVSNSIRIKLPGDSDSVMGTTLRLVDENTGIEEARGSFNSIVELQTEKAMTLSLRWGFQKKAYSKDYIFTVMPGKKYALSWAPGWLMPKLVCNEVDSFTGL